MKYDEKHGKLWYGTPHSTVNCLDLKPSEPAEPYLEISGTLT